MAARICPSCNGLVASTIEHCPHCGYHIGFGTQEQQAPTFNAASAYNPKTANIGANPHNSILWIIVPIFLCWPFAIPSLIYYFKSDKAWNVGLFDLARVYGVRNRRWGTVPIYLWAAILIILTVCFLISEAVINYDYNEFDYIYDYM